MPQWVEIIFEVALFLVQARPSAQALLVIVFVVVVIIFLLIFENFLELQEWFVIKSALLIFIGML